jgi:hypothetical protein
MAAREFAPWHRWDRNFALLFVLAAWTAVLIGFYPAVSGRWRGEADYPAPAILQIHVFSFVGWLCLLTAQVMLIRIARVRWHMRLGALGACLIPVLVVTGIGAEAYSQRFYSPQFPANLRFFAFPLMTMLSFVIAGAAAVLLRADSPAHKRLMLLATALILEAAYNRWWGDPIYQALGDGYFGTLVRNCAGPDLLIAGLIAYDLATRRHVHRALTIAAPLVLIGQLAATAAYHSEWWPPLVRAMAGVPGSGG